MATKIKARMQHLGAIQRTIERDKYRQLQLAREHWVHKIDEATDRETGTPGRGMLHGEESRSQSRANLCLRARKTRADD
jgi:hypothetical protein